MVHPVGSHCAILLEQVPSENPVATGILDIDVEVGALHIDDDVEIDLQVVGDALLDGKKVRFGAGPPSAQLGECEEGGDDDENDGHVATPGGAAGICRFCFG